MSPRYQGNYVRAPGFAELEKETTERAALAMGLQPSDAIWVPQTPQHQRCHCCKVAPPAMSQAGARSSIARAPVAIPSRQQASGRDLLCSITVLGA